VHKVHPEVPDASFPAGHKTQRPSNDSLPVGQSSHAIFDTGPLASTPLPGGQIWQANVDESGAIKPAGHVVHADAPASENVPGEHDVQLCWATAF
tara:strand:+ start:615 stop:899 length:285 start_codon:yes stop_codon:yes gene_type:complete